MQGKRAFQRLQSKPISVVEIDGHQLVNALQPLSIQDHDDDDRDQDPREKAKSETRDWLNNVEAKLISLSV
nr:hypothetical protein CFP56_44499 [Quercus suber]